MAKRVRRSKVEREAFWRREFEDWQQSGQTITHFAASGASTLSTRLVFDSAIKHS
jgi:hypothetical protein